MPYASRIIRCITHGFVETKNGNIVDVYSTRSVCATCGTEVAVRSVWDDVAALCSSDKISRSAGGTQGWLLLLANPGRKPVLDQRWFLERSSFAMSRITSLNRSFKLGSCTTVTGLQ